MNVNLLGEVYQEKDCGSNYIIQDKSKGMELYYKIKKRTTILAYPLFIDDTEFQMIYEARDCKVYNKLIKEYKEKLYSFQELTKADYCEMFKRRLNNIDKNTFKETYMNDFRRASEIGIIKCFPYLKDNTEFNRIFGGRVLGENLIVTDNYVKVTLNKAYKSNHNKILIKRMPEKKLEFYTVVSPCTTEIKFKTTDVSELIELCKEIEEVEHYYRSDLFEKDIENKLETAISLVANGSYNESLCYRLLSVFSLALYRCDITAKTTVGKDLISNVVLENKSFFTEFIETASKYLQQDVLKYLKGIYLRSEYRSCY